MQLFKLLRVHHWVKNTFIFLPLFFSGPLFDGAKFIEIFSTSIGFCFVASFIYIVNDIIDLEFDKIHPEKKLRPIAANIISIKKALIIGFIILFTGVIIVYNINESAFYLTLLYVFMNLLYSYKLKKIPIIDFIIVSIGFVIRLHIGGIVAEIELSEWIILMIFLLSLFIAISKRRDDLVLLANTKKLNRDVIKKYSIVYLDNIQAIVSSILLVSYLMYVTDDDIQGKYNSNLSYMTFVFVLLGIFRYSHLSIVYKKSGSPVRIFYTDTFIQITLFLWVLSFFVLIY